MNVCTLTGRIARDPETRYTQSGMAVCNISIAVDRDRKAEGQPDVDFFNIVAFGKTGEFVQQYLDKGARIEVTGRLQNREWEKDGQKRTSTEIVADRIGTLETRAEADARRQRSGNIPPAAQASPGAPAGPSGGQQVPNAAPTQHAPPQGHGGISQEEDPFADQ